MNGPLYCRRGEPGVTGPTGDQGDKGDTGVRGPDGDDGDRGDQGLKGDRGSKGGKGTGTGKKLVVMFIFICHKSYIQPYLNYCFEVWNVFGETRGVARGGLCVWGGDVTPPIHHGLGKLFSD
jgi:hypothetical protein